MAPAPKRRKLAPSSRQELDVDGDQDWRSDELSSLPGSDEDSSGSDDEEEEDDDSQFATEDDEEDDDDIEDEDRPVAPVSGSTVQIIIPTTAASPEKRKRGRPKKDPADKPPKIPKKRGRPRKYAPGEKPKYRRSRRKLNPDGSFKKRGRPKKVINPEDIVPKVPKKRGRPRKNPLAEEQDTVSKRRSKKEFDLLAGLDLDFEDDESIVADAGEHKDDRDPSRAGDTEDDILAKLRRRILYRQQDAELQDFVERPTVPKAVSQESPSKPMDSGPRLGLPQAAERNAAGPSIPSSEKRKERQPFEPSVNESSQVKSASDAADDKTKGRLPGNRSRQPVWQDNPLFEASRGAASTSSHGAGLVQEGDDGIAASDSRHQSTRTGAMPAKGSSKASSLVRPTSSDAYFLFNTSKKARGAAGLAIGTSTALISSKLGALQPSWLESVVREQTRVGTIADAACKLYECLLPVYTAQLLAGYSIVFHGVGSKVDLLTKLVLKRIHSHGDAVGIVAQGAIKAFKVEDMLAQVESAVGLGSMSSTTAQQERDQDHASTHVASTLTVSRAHRIAAYFSPKQQHLRRKRKGDSGPDRLFLILETFDAPGMQNPRFRSVLDILGACSDIHIMATVEHVNSGLVIGSHHGSALDVEASEDVGRGQASAKRLTWIWHNISTFVPSLNEMLIMRSNPAFSSWMPSLPSALDLLGSTGRLHSHHGMGAASSAEGTNVSLFNGLAVSEASANVSHQSAISILKSVTTKARALFNLVAKQTFALSSDEPESTTNAGIAYTELLTKAKKGFLVSNEADFKSLLVEFLDHQLLQITKQGSIRIGLENQQVLRKVVEQMKTL